MKKVFLVVQNKDILSAMKTLRKAGMVHVEHEQKPAGPRIYDFKEEARTLREVVSLLSQQEPCPDQIGVDDWKEKAGEVLSLAGEINQCREDITRRQGLIEQWEPWGDFNPADIRALEEKGIYVQLVEIPVSVIASEEKQSRLLRRSTPRNDAQIPHGVLLKKIFVKNKIAYCLAISRQKEKLPFHVVPLPANGLSELQQMQEADNKKIKEAEGKIRDAAMYLESFQNTLSGVEEDLAFQEVYDGRGQEEQFAFLKGFCPGDRAADLQGISKKEHWGLLIQDPADGERVPTLLRNPQWVNLIKPVFDFIDILPGYKEVDISLFFLLFFSIFVGMLIGDAGYGLLFILLTSFLHVTVGRKIADKTPFFLIYILSGFTVFWGILTGTFFGQLWLPEGTIKPLVPWLNNLDNIQMFCFLLGAVHLSVAHVWRLILKIPSIAFLAEIGWLSLVWGMYYAAKMLILGAALPPFVKILFVAGPILVIFFTRPAKNPLKSIGPGIGDFLLNVINTFTDVVSYIRLFAVGLATVAVADAANTMALEVGFGTVGSGIGAMLILFVGHLINIILAVMAILVHGLRLNVLEFSGHLNMEWAGFGYNPFRRIRKA